MSALNSGDGNHYARTRGPEGNLQTARIIVESKEESLVDYYSRLFENNPPLCNHFTTGRPDYKIMVRVNLHRLINIQATDINKIIYRFK